MDNGMMERRFRALRNHLDELGYRHPLTVESVSLVDRLVSDLLHTTERLRHYKGLAQKSLEESRNIQSEVEPYKLENARLVQECNDLHLKLLHQQEEGAVGNPKDLRLRVRKLERENSDLQLQNSQRLERINVLEQESADKTIQIKHLQRKCLRTIISPPGHKQNTLPTEPETTLESGSPFVLRESWQEKYNRLKPQAKNALVANMIEMADQEIAGLNREINVLKEENIQQLDVVATMKDKLGNQDKEIQFLRGLLDGSRPVRAARKDSHCSCKQMAHQLNALSNEIEILEREKRELMSSQHEATTRAAMLADRNKRLEKELRDFDQIAIAAEAEYNSTLEKNTQRVAKLQAQIENNLKQILGLEQEVLELKRTNQKHQANMGRAADEKLQPQWRPQSSLDDTKNLDRINDLTIIELDLNQEIERLIKETTLQKRRIGELEFMLASRVTDPGSVSEETQVTDSSENTPNSKSPAKALIDKIYISIREGSSPVGSSASLSSQQYAAWIEKLQAEKDFYYAECHRLKEQAGAPAFCTNCMELRRKLTEKTEEVLKLRQANRELIKENEIVKSLLHREAHSSVSSPITSLNMTFSPPAAWHPENGGRRQI
jgi:centrosomal protein CEP135